MSILDTHGRSLRSLRLSVTDRCNLRCQYCMPESDYVWLERQALLSFEEMSRLVDIFAATGVDRVRITGGEPLLRRDLSALIRMLAAKPSIADLAMTTNGLLLGSQAAELKAAGLHRVTVSLDTLRPDRFTALTRFDSLEVVREGLRVADQIGFPSLKLDTVVMRGVNDDELGDLIEFGRTIGAEVRFIEYMDVGGATRWSMDAVVPRPEILRALEARYGAIEPVAECHTAPADRFALPDGTMFGVISSTTQPFCHACDRSRVTADGVWFLCLYAQDGVDLRGPLRNGDGEQAIQDRIVEAWARRIDRGAEKRLRVEERQPLIPVSGLRQNAHLEMHTRGG